MLKDVFQRRTVPNLAVKSHPLAKRSNGHGWLSEKPGHETGMHGVQFTYIYIYVHLFVHLFYIYNMGGSINGGTPKWMAYSENPIKMDD